MKIGLRNSKNSQIFLNLFLKQLLFFQDNNKLFNKIDCIFYLRNIFFFSRFHRRRFILINQINLFNFIFGYFFIY